MSVVFDAVPVIVTLGTTNPLASFATTSIAPAVVADLAMFVISGVAVSVATAP